MSSISKEQIEHIAKLARMELTEKEKEKFSDELSSILDYVGQLNKVDTSKVEALTQVTGLEDVIRDDMRTEMRIKSELNADMRNKILKQAPKKKKDYFKVPRILE